MAEEFSEKEIGIEKGVTGVPQFEGRIGDRHLSILQGPEGVAQMARMMRAEPSCYTISHTVELVARQSDWLVRPHDPKNSADVEAADFVASCMDDMSHSWWTFIKYALSSQAFGFADVEIVWKRSLGRYPAGDLPSSQYDDGLIRPRRLPVRRQESIARWVLDNRGRPTAMIQLDPDTGDELPPIDIKKTLHFVTGDDRGGWEGLGWLEPGYGLYHMVRNLEVFLGIAHQRAHVGLPVVKWKRKPSSALKEAVVSMCKGLSVNEQAYVMYPEEYLDFDIQTVRGAQIDEMRTAVVQYRYELMSLGLLQFIRLGTQRGGTQALALTLANLFKDGVDSALTEIADTLNRHFVPRLLRANPTLDSRITGYPIITHEGVQRLPENIMAYLGSLAAWMNGARVEDEQWLRAGLGMPQLSPLEIEAKRNEIEERRELERLARETALQRQISGEEAIQNGEATPEEVDEEIQEGILNEESAAESAMSTAIEEFLLARDMARNGLVDESLLFPNGDSHD